MWLTPWVEAQTKSIAYAPILSAEPPLEVRKNLSKSPPEHCAE
jgi:hypothetical protein